MTARMEVVGTTRDLGSLVRHAMAASTSDLVTLEGGSSTWRRTPWSRVGEVAEAVAVRLIDRSAADGSRSPIGIVGDPTMETVAVMSGAWLAGRAVAILPGPPRGRPNRVWEKVTADRFEELGCDHVFIGAEISGRIELARGAISEFHEVGNWTGSLDGYAIAAQDSDPAVLQGTAGSTGSPKTAVLSRGAVVRHCEGFRDRVDGDPGRDVGCSWLPLYHDMGLTSLSMGMAFGGPTWLAPTSAFARSPFEWLRWLSESKATLTAAPNFAYNLLGQYARRVDGIDLSNLQYVINGGEPVDSDGLSRFASEMARFGLAPGAIAPSYGMAEATCGVTAPTKGTGLVVDEIELHGQGEKRAMRMASLGSAMPGMEIRVASGDEHPRAPGREIGEIEIRGHSMMNGYLGASPLAPSDWFPTGDIGYERNGSWFVCGRTKEMLTVAGANLFPQQVEQVVGRMPGVRAGAVAATVVDTKSKGALSRPELIVVAEFRGKDAKSSREQIRENIVAECGVVPSVVELVAPGVLPRTTSGKLRRLEVAELFRDGTIQRTRG